jgi:hypothetical protein
MKQSVLQLNRRGLLQVVALGLVVMSLAWSARAYAADTTPPTTPGNFQATVTSEDAIVTLKWAVSTDASGIKSYHLERSLDQSSWSALGTDIIATTFQDTSAGYGLHYYYRLSAVDMAGNASAWAMTDVTTRDATTPSDGAKEGVYTSDDKVVTVRVPSGATSREVNCSVGFDNNITAKGTSTKKVIAGPYFLLCKTATGDRIPTFKDEVTWVFDLKSKLKGAQNPSAYTYEPGGSGTEADGAEYDSKAQTLTFISATSNSAAVLAEVPKGISFNLIVVFLVPILAAVGIVWLVMRQKKKLDYDEYIRSKYYDL